MTSTTRNRVSSRVYSTSCDRLFDGERPVKQDVDRDGRRQLVAEGGKELLDGLGHLDRIGAGLTLDREDHGPLLAGAVKEPCRRFVVFHAVGDFGHIAEPHGRAVAVGHDQRPVGIGRVELPRRQNGERPMRAVENPRGHVHIAVLDGLCHFIDADPFARQRHGVEFHSHGILLRAEDLHLGHAKDSGDPLSQQGLGVLVQLVQGKRRTGQGQVENRLVGRVDLLVRRADWACPAAGGARPARWPPARPGRPRRCPASG